MLMMWSINVLAITALATLTFAKVHHLYVGNLFFPASIHALEFDDKALTLKKTKTFPADSSHAWIAFDHNKKNIYGSSLNNKSISSYSIHNNLNGTSLRLDASIASADACFNKTSAFVIPATKYPYTVYTASWPGPAGCAQVLSTHKNGTLSKVVQSLTYSNVSATHGLAFGPESNLLYSADLSGDRIWVHERDDEGGLEKRVEWRVKNGSHPRHLAAHPDGNFLHVLMEHDNDIVEYGLDYWDGKLKKETGTWSLIPAGANRTLYWSAEVMYSHSNRYLWATARALSNSTNTGYISCFELSEKGGITKKLFMVPTTTVGGIANAVSPATWSDEFVAMTDYPRGYVQIWQFIKPGKGKFGNATAKAVAKVDIADGGCCANAIWYD